MVVLPAPVGPTIATVLPGSAHIDRSSITGVPGRYAKLTCSNSTRPVGRWPLGRGFIG